VRAISWSCLSACRVSAAAPFASSPSKKLLRRRGAAVEGDGQGPLLPQPAL
jgi:hypothetical protein